MSNLASILESRLTPDNLRWLRALSEASRSKADGIWLVGGAVRDLLLQRPIAELDISVSGLNERIALELAGAVGGTLTARSQFNTFKIENDSLRIDLAMTRQESYPHPGSLPDVRPGTIVQDLARRDFSVNAMAVDISPAGWGDLLDPLDGQGDLELRVIRALHRDSFADDATRIFRAVRYSQRLGFRLEDETAELLQSNLGRLDAISGDRLRHEFQKVFAEEHPGPVLSRLDDLGVLESVFRPLRRGAGPWREGLDRAPAFGELAWLSALSCGLSTGETAQFVQRLNMDSGWAGVVRDVVEIEGILDKLGARDVSRSRINQLLHRFHSDALLGVAAVHDAAPGSRNIDLYLRELHAVRAELTGRDLIALGVSEGPDIGRLLQALLEARLDGSVADKQGEEALVRGIISRG